MSTSCGQSLLLFIKSQNVIIIIVSTYLVAVIQMTIEATYPLASVYIFKEPKYNYLLFIQLKAQIRKSCYKMYTFIPTLSQFLRWKGGYSVILLVRISPFDFSILLHQLDSDIQIKNTPQLSDFCP